MAYDHLVAPIIESIKELNKRIVELLKVSKEHSRTLETKADKAEVERLKLENAAKDQKIKQLEERLERIEKIINSKR